MTDSTPPRPDLATAARLLADLSAPDAATPRPEPLRVLGPMALARGRVHELTGPARRTLACVAVGAAQTEGVVMWFRPGWRAEALYPQGMAGFLPDPGAVVWGRCAKAVEVLWAMEEALRAGCVALVLGEVAEAPDLRQIRRLHLAASEGVARNRQAGRAAPAPLGLLLAHEVAQSRIAGVESRWALHPVAPKGGEGPGWRLDRLLARTEPPQTWAVTLRDLRQHAHPLAQLDGLAMAGA